MTAGEGTADTRRGFQESAADYWERDSGGVMDEHLKKVLRVRELFRGRFTHEEVETLLELNNDDQGRTVFYILSSDTQEIRRILQNSQDVVSRLEYVRRNVTIVQDARENHIGLALRQFTCTSCHRMWWRTVPRRKPVSRCRNCQQKFDAVPTDVEFGWGEFHCQHCSNHFWGFGQKATTRSRCYRCQQMCYPVRIEPPSNTRHTRRRRHWTPQLTDAPGNYRRPVPSHDHSCDAPDCFNRIDLGRDMAVRGPSGLPKKCVHPRSQHGQISDFYLCDRHQTTGSTVSTFLTQDNYTAVPSDFTPSLGTLNEEHETSEDDDDDNEVGAADDQ